MQKKQWLHTIVGLALVRALVLPVYGQDGMPPAAVHPATATPALHTRASSRGGAYSFENRMSQAVGLSPEQRDAVHGLLAEQRKQHTAIQEQTDSKIRGMLNPEQQKKFDAFLAEQKAERAARYRRPS